MAIYGSSSTKAKIKNGLTSLMDQSNAPVIKIDQTVAYVNQYHIFYADKGWHVKNSHGKVSVNSFGTKMVAVAWAVARVTQCQSMAKRILRSERSFYGRQYEVKNNQHNLKLAIDRNDECRMDILRTKLSESTINRDRELENLKRIVKSVRVS